MKIALADAGFAYDGSTPGQRPLDGAERAVIGLARALAARGHEVTVYNGCRTAVRIDGVAWEPLPGQWRRARLTESLDALIAIRRPALLGFASEARRRILWPMAAPDYLTWPNNRLYLDKYTPTLAYLGITQRGASPLSGGVVVTPGVDAVFAPGDSAARQDPPFAVIATHPLHGLDETLDLWAGLIHRQAPEARLLVYSALLARAAEGETMPSALARLAEKVQAMAAQGVEVHAPLPAAGMAEVYRRARVLLYPGHAADMACLTLAEAQASGLTAIARARGAAHERLENGETGYLVPDGAAFANVCVTLLTNADLAAAMGARAATRRRTWDDAARDFELLMA